MHILSFVPIQRPLTPRQHVILRSVARGKTNKDIAAELGISEQGVKVHISRLLERYGAENRVELLLPAEDTVYETRFDIPLLTRRLATVAQWIAESRAANDLPLGLFGASTGAAAALRLAGSEKAKVAAVVSRGGRPDLAGSLALRNVRAPTLLIIGTEDHGGIELNRAAYEKLRGEKQIELVAGATHLFEEPGTLSTAALLARHWFERHLRADIGTFAFMR